MSAALEGKVVAITGAGRGVGRGHALTLAAEGARIVVNDIGGSVDGTGTDKRVADEVVDLIKAAGGDAVANYGDISTWSGAAELVDQAVSELGSLDGLVNNAGVLLNTDFLTCTEDEFDRVMRVHVKGTFAGMKAAMSHWAKIGPAPAGTRPIVNTVSDAMLLGLADPVYGAAKAAVAHLTLVGGVDRPELGVRTNAIAPRAATRMSRSSAMMDYSNAAPPSEAENADRSDPAHPANTSPLVAWLVSDLSRHVNGQVFRTLGGGFTLCRPWSFGEISYPSSEDHMFTIEDVDHTVNAFLFGSEYVRRRLDFAPGDKRVQTP